MSQDWKSASAGDEAEVPEEAGKVQAPGTLRPADPDCELCFGTGYMSVEIEHPRYGRVNGADRCACTKVEVSV